jgi:hypothetical protein
MRQITPTTSSPQPRFSPGYDCELPSDARTELVMPKRSRILKRPQPPALDPTTRGRLILLGFAVLVMAAGLAALWRQGETERVSNQAISPLPTPQSTPTPSRSQNGQLRLSAESPAPRAALISVPYWVNLPDGRHILVNYRGEVPDVWALPPQHGINNAMYHDLESGHDWIWTVPINSNIPMWIDP